MPPESRLYRRVRKYLDERGGRWVKIQGSPDSYQEVGISDILGCYRGRFVAIELKQPGEKLSRRQEKFLNEVTEAGGFTLVATSVEEVEELIHVIDLEVNSERR